MSKKTYTTLNFRKTPQAQRGTYVYEFLDGQRVTIVPDEQGCTQIDIRQLHAMDDHEVYVNIKNARPPVEAWQKPLLEQWKQEHPGEQPDKNWNISLDQMLDGDGGEDDAASGYLKRALYREAVNGQETDSPTERMNELVSGLKPRLQAVYQLALLDRIPNTRVAEMLGVSEGMIRKDIKAIKKALREDEKLQSFFR